jgi:dTMP kinase
MQSEEQIGGLFISFEGSEGCGKSTQIGMLIRHFEACGTDVLLVREPGGTPIGEQVRHLLQHAPEGREMCPETELLLFAASRAQLVRQVILPALDAGRIVISDRFLDSTTVYQGIARRIPPDRVAAINRFAAGQRLPDVTFLLDMDAGEGMKRLRLGRGRAAPSDRMEEQPAAFYRAVRDGYLALAAAEPQRIRVLDGAAPPDVIARKILDHLEAIDHVLLERIGS